MNIYNRFILPALLDRSMRRNVLNAPRDRLLRRTRGRVLEIGFGAGANLPFYPGWIHELEVVEPDGHIMKRAAQRIADTGLIVHPHQGAAEALPFPDEHFDTVVSTFTLCSVADPIASLREVSRVLKKRGQFLFLEHGLCEEPGVARWQHRLNGCNACLGGGCQLTRDVGELIKGSGMMAEMKTYFLPNTPRIGGFMFEGVACRQEPLMVEEAA